MPIQIHNFSKSRLKSITKFLLKLPKEFKIEDHISDCKISWNQMFSHQPEKKMWTELLRLKHWESKMLFMITQMNWLMTSRIKIMMLMILKPLSLDKRIKRRRKRRPPRKLELNKKQKLLMNLHQLKTQKATIQCSLESQSE